MITFNKQLKITHQIFHHVTIQQTIVYYDTVIFNYYKHYNNW